MRAGAVLIRAAAGIFAMYDRQEWEARENADKLLLQVQQQMIDQASPLPVKEQMAEYNLGKAPPLGILEIETLELQLPILDKWNYQLLTIAPCRYAGSAEERNLILLGHNYDRHFGALKTLACGDEMILRNMDGTVFCYQVDLVETLESTQLEELVSSNYDMSIFTCTPGGARRVVVRGNLKTVNGIKI